ncbi:hypothetical protein ACJJTC_010799 [Scirpophaga incertulas]
MKWLAARRLVRCGGVPACGPARAARPARVTSCRLFLVRCGQVAPGAEVGDNGNGEDSGESWVVSELGAATRLCCVAAVPTPVGFDVWAGGDSLSVYSVTAAGVCGAETVDVAEAVAPEAAPAGDVPPEDAAPADAPPDAEAPPAATVALLAAHQHLPHVVGYCSPGTCLYQWCGVTRRRTARLDCGKLAPCSEPVGGWPAAEPARACQVRQHCMSARHVPVPVVRRDAAAHGAAGLRQAGALLRARGRLARRRARPRLPGTTAFWRPAPSPWAAGPPPSPPAPARYDSIVWPPGTCLYQWCGVTRRRTARLDCGKLAPCSEPVGGWPAAEPARACQVRQHCMAARHVPVPVVRRDAAAHGAAGLRQAGALLRARTCLYQWCGVTRRRTARLDCGKLAPCSEPVGGWPAAEPARACQVRQHCMAARHVPVPVVRRDAAAHGAAGLRQAGALLRARGRLARRRARPRLPGTTAFWRPAPSPWAAGPPPSPPAPARYDSIVWPPGTCLYQWCGVTRRRTARLDCGKLAPCSEPVGGWPAAEPARACQVRQHCMAARHVPVPVVRRDAAAHGAAGLRQAGALLRARGRLARRRARPRLPGTRPRLLPL